MWIARIRAPLWRGVPLHRPLSTFRGRRTPRGPRGSIVRPEPIPQTKRVYEPSKEAEPVSSDSHSPQAANYDPSQNTLLSPVYIPEDPNAVLKENHPATNVLANSGLVVQRQLEMMNVMM